MKIIEDENYRVNEKKTVFMTPKTRKSITGITLNDIQLKAPRELKKKGAGNDTQINNIR